MNRKEREVRETIAEAGAELLALERTGGSHWRARCRLPDGAEQVVFFSGTPSDRRAILNKRSHLRRLVREHTK